jgi:class 3 adenylate cyclase
MSRTTELAICFADICDSTALFEEHGDDRARDIVGRVLGLLSDVIGDYNGTVVKTIGDEVMGTFPELLAATSAVSTFPRAVASDDELAALGVEIRVGMCYGSVVQEDNGDVYGDAVNTASRLVDWARPAQVVTTAETLAPLPDYFESRTRNLGATTLRGKEQAVEIVELLGEQSGSNLTVVEDRGPVPDRRRDRTVLCLQHDDRRITVEQGPVMIGRGAESDLRVADSRVSRSHAVIERQRDAFLLTDSSTNGTYVQIGDEEVLFLHREQLRLHGSGQLSLGRQLGAEEARPLRFRCETRSEA